MKSIIAVLKRDEIAVRRRAARVRSEVAAQRLQANVIRQGLVGRDALVLVAEERPALIDCDSD